MKSLEDSTDIGNYVQVLAVPIRGKILLVYVLLLIIEMLVTACRKPGPVFESGTREPLGPLFMATDVGVGSTGKIRIKFLHDDVLFAKPSLSHQRLASPKPVTRYKFLQPLFFTEEEPNNSLDKAQRISIPCKILGHLDPFPQGKWGDEDWYSFSVDLTTIGRLSLSVTPPSKVDIEWTLLRLGPFGKEKIVTCDLALIGGTEKADNLLLVNGDYLLQVRSSSRLEKPVWNVVTPYQIDIRVGEIRLAEELEPNNSMKEAAQLRLQEKVHGVANSLQDEDWFAVDVGHLPLGTYLTLTLLPAVGTTARVSVWSEFKTKIVTFETEPGRQLFVPNLGVFDDSSVYYFVVESNIRPGQKGTYTLEVKQQRRLGTTELEPNNSPNQAFAVVIGSMITGWLCPDHDVDYYLLQPRTGQNNLGKGLAHPLQLHVAVGEVSGIDLTIDLFQDDCRSQLAHIDFAGPGRGETLPNFPVNPEEQLCVKLASLGGKSSPTPYVLLTESASRDNVELEPNNSPEFANLVPLPTSYVEGFLAPAGDRDCFKFTQHKKEVSLETFYRPGLQVVYYDDSGVVIRQQQTYLGKKLVITGPQTFCIQAILPSSEEEQTSSAMKAAGMPTYKLSVLTPQRGRQ